MSNPIINLAAKTAPTEGGVIGSYLITLNTPAPVGGLTVNFNTTGSTATLNNDYNFMLGDNLTAATANSFTIAAGATSATLNLVAYADAVSDSNETVHINLTAGTGYDLAQQFAPKVDYVTGTNPVSVSMGDFNGDGKLDLAVANQGSNTVSILLRNADNTGFDPRVNYTTSSVPNLVSVGDFNGDGKDDLAIANWLSGTISVLQRNATNTGFDPIVYYSVGQANSVSVGDFNGDGKDDLAIANAGSTTISVLQRNATNTGFDAKADYATTGGNPRSVSIGDFNGDGKLDLEYISSFAYSNDAISVLLRNATNTGFDPSTHYVTGTSLSSDSFGDFNNDGKVDLVVANFNSRSVSVLLRNATDTGFDPPAYYSVGAYPSSVSVGDFNNDGKVDLVAANQSDNKVSVLLRNADNADNTGFDPQVTYATGTNPVSVIVGDFNGDGKLDLAVSNVGSNTVSVLLNNGTSAATLTIADASQNTAPVAVNDTLAATEDTPITYLAADLLGNDTDAEGNLLSLASVSSGTNGTAVLSLDGKTVTFTPNENFNGVANFTYQASDGTLPSNSATVTVNVAAVNDAPVGVSDNNASDPVIETGSGVAGDSRAVGNVLSNDTDADNALGLGETKTVNTVNNQNSNVGSAVTGLYGSLTLSADGNYTYTLDNTKAATNALSTGQVVVDTFTYTVVDAHGASSAPTTLSISITGSDDKSYTYNGHTYMLNNSSSLSWQQAETQAVSLGGHLVTINDAAEQAWLAATFTNGGWIGYTDQATEGTFQWISGEPTTYTNWYPGEPNNGQNQFEEDHAHMYPGGWWNDASNTGILAGIIEIPNTNISNNLLSGYSWTLDASSPVLTYSFYEDSVFGGSYYDSKSKSELGGVASGVSENVKNNVRSILGWLETVINVSFEEVTETSNTYGSLRVMGVDADDGVVIDYAHAHYPWSATDPVSGDIHLDSSYDFYNTTNTNDPLITVGFQNPAGFSGYEGLIHELGHTLGLKHPFDAPVLPAELSNTTNTVMTYNTFGWQEGTTVLHNMGIAGTYMPLDIEALQSLYGERPKNTGDDTYLFSEVSHYTVNGKADLDGTYPTKQTIWDTGGTDTLDLSTLVSDGTGYRIDLNKGGFLCETALYNTCQYSDTYGDGSTNYTTVELTAFANGVTLENLIGSSSNDIIIGNSANNILRGSGGNDTIDGGIGTDTAVYGAWANYTVTGNSTSATITDLTGTDGTDTLNSIENLTFNGVTVTTEAAVNDAPVGVSDNNASDAVIEAGSGVAGDSSAVGNVLSNDTDADSALGLGETKTVNTVNNQNTNVGSAVAGLYGSLVLLADGNYIYTLDNTKTATNALSTGQVVVDTFTYTLVDAHGASSAPTTLSISITGSDDTSYTYNGHTYMLTNSSSVNWQQAETQAVSLGGHLVTINDAAEQAWLVATFKTGGWIGYTDQVAEGTFQWNSGETTTYTNWYPGEPNDFGGNEDYALMYSDGLWNDNNGSPLFQGIIEIPNPVNNAPVANNDTLSATEDTPIIYAASQLLGNDTDADGNLLSLASVTSGTNGTAVLSADHSTVTFTPNENFSGVGRL